MAKSGPFPHVDATKQDCITDEQAQFFRDNGLLVIRNVVRGGELRAMQEQTGALVERAGRERVNDPDYAYAQHAITKQTVPYRIEYIIEKTDAGKVLLGHPFILRSVEKLQTRDFIPTWDSVVFKAEGAGAAVPWHRDAGTESTGQWPIFNVDFYLDRADESNCVWGVPGSNLWSDERAKEVIAKLNTDGFQRPPEAVPITMSPGDVLLHDILVLHGSPATQTKLRRVVYYEFRPIRIELAKGPHVPGYVPLKQRVLERCLRHRAESPVSKGEKPFAYSPSEEFTRAPLGAREEITTYRYPHDQYWRKPGENVFADPWEDADSPEVQKRVADSKAGKKV